MKKVVIFDLGNVVSPFNPMNIYTKYTDNQTDAQLIYNILINKEVWFKLDTGQPVSEIIELAQAEVPTRLHHAIELILTNWMDELGLDQAIVTLIKELVSRKVKVYLLSNVSNQFGQFKTKHHDLFDLFTGLYISAQSGLIKPDLAIYQDFEKMFSLKGEQCYFIDDKLENVQVPSQLGWSGFHYQNNPDKLRESLFSFLNHD